MKVCFIGHRNINDNIKERLRIAIEYEIKNNIKHFLIGSHGDFDNLALSVCKELKTIYPDILIEVIVTSLHKANKQLIHDDIFGKQYFTPYNDVQLIMYEIEEIYFKKRITISNQKMINECDILICYINNKKKYSGAKIAMNYAKKKGLKIVNLHSDN